MESRTIPASELPQISGLIKDVINMGLWFLYDIHCKSNPDAKYALATDKNEFLLDNEVLEYLSKITFSGIPTAPTVNMPLI